MPDVKKKAQTNNYLSHLAEGVKTDPHFQSIQEWLGGRDIGDVFSPSAVGFTKQAAVKEIVKTFFDPTIPSQSKQFLRGALADLLRVVGKTPKKATQHIGEFNLSPGSLTSGTYHPKRITIFPTDVGSTMASTFAHEAGHGATIPMAGRIQKRYSDIGSTSQRPEKVGLDLYNYYSGLSKQASFEGVAEYISHHLQKQAGLKPEIYFGHGTGQQRAFEELSKMPSKNPYFNVLRYLEGILKK